MEDILQNTLSVLFELVKGIKNKESLRNCCSYKEPKETEWLHVMWYPGWDLGIEEIGKNWKKNLSMKYGL